MDSTSRENRMSMEDVCSWTECLVRMDNTDDMNEFFKNYINNADKTNAAAYWEKVLKMKLNLKRGNNDFKRQKIGAALLDVIDGYMSNVPLVDKSAPYIAWKEDATDGINIGIALPTIPKKYSATRGFKLMLDFLNGLHEQELVQLSKVTGVGRRALNRDQRRKDNFLHVKLVPGTRQPLRREPDNDVENESEAESNVDDLEKNNNDNEGKEMVGGSEGWVKEEDEGGVEGNLGVYKKSEKIRKKKR
ncbi:hypothetical protein HDU76_007954 [Blyttiomyces sp. JEL0837]|nr:hypothetical protein HDU76_007954 [Blyttiomyces sp. JEL0837]